MKNFFGTYFLLNVVHYNLGPWAEVLLIFPASPVNRVKIFSIFLSDPSFFLTFKLICRCYLRLYDYPSKSSAEEDEEMSRLPASHKKKLRQKQRKAEARAKKVINFADLLM